MLFGGDCCPAKGKYHIQTNVYPVELTAPLEELLTVAINDTPNTLFFASITGLFCHNFLFCLPLI